MFGENSIVGAGAPIAAGAALAATFDGSGRVAVAAFGDGAVNQGAVHEAMNFASIRNLPVVFVVENNKYSEMTPISAMVRDERLFKRAAPYGFPGARVDGNDAAAVENAMRTAVAHARSGKGPVLLEAITQRIVGHYIGDAEHYRPTGEKEAALAAEPIGRLRAHLLDNGTPPDVLAHVEGAARELVQAAARAALDDPYAVPNPGPEQLYAGG